MVSPKNEGTIEGIIRNYYDREDGETTLRFEAYWRYGLGLILYRAPCAIKGVLRKNTENLNNKIIKLNEELSDCETDLYNYKRDTATNTITFSLSNFEKPLSFNCDEFTSVIGLNYNEKYVSIPTKETVRAGLATLGLVDENNSGISSTSLDLDVDIGNIIFFDLVAKLLNGKNVNVDDTADKPLSEASVQPINQSKAPTDKKSRKKNNPASYQPKTIKIVRESSPLKQVADTQHVEEPVATADTTKSVDAFESAKVLEN
ncbi:hypothetical protein Tco_1474427 [Tanacetum coccineum]